MRRRVQEARVGRMATVRPDGSPHVVPIVYALDEDRLYSAVDEKPKTTPRLQRLRNIANEPRVEVLVDEYTDDWRRLWWVRLSGRARVLHDGPEHDAGWALLAAKYEQYRDATPEAVMVVEIDRWKGWSYAVG